MANIVTIAGATGYIGSRLAGVLLERGHEVYGIARQTSVRNLPARCHPVIGNVLDASTYQDSIAGGGTFVHLIGTSHPAPWKEREFIAVDLASVRESLRAAEQAGLRHFVYVSVAHPAPVMKSYIGVREQCEQLIEQSGLNATILRPWYVLGPGHRWPVMLKPLYWFGERIEFTREGARRLGLITLDDMVRALVKAVEQPAQGRRIVEVSEMRARD